MLKLVLQVGRGSDRSKGESKMYIETTTETLAELKSKMSVTPGWVKDLIHEFGADAVVEVERKHTAFGTFINNAKVVSA